jgi:hypothetical protein
VALAYRWAFGHAAALEVGEDEVDAATLHCADFLRQFATAGVDSVLLVEANDGNDAGTPQDASELEWYRAVLNVGAHYRWDMGLHLPGARFAGDLGPSAARDGAGGFAFVIASSAFNAPCVGRVIAEEFWSGALETLPQADFHFSAIPLGIPPEVVLDRLSVLRQS